MQYDSSRDSPPLALAPHVASCQAGSRNLNGFQLWSQLRGNRRILPSLIWYVNVCHGIPTLLERCGKCENPSINIWCFSCICVCICLHIYMLTLTYIDISHTIICTYVWVLICVHVCLQKHSRITFNNHKLSHISPNQPLSRPYSLRHGCSFRAHLCQTLVQHLRESSMISLREIFHPAYQWKGQFPIHKQFSRVLVMFCMR